jgi:hypothetical protein
MTTVQGVAEVVSLVALGLFAGVLVTEALVILPALGTVEPSAVHQMRGPLSAAAWRLGPPMGTTAVVSTLAAVVLGTRSTEAVAVGAVGLGLLVCAVAVTFRAYAPAELALRELPEDRPADELQQAIARMARAHAWRLAACVTALVLVATAAQLD